MQNKYNLDDKFVILRDDKIEDVIIIGIEITKEKIKYQIRCSGIGCMQVYENELHKDIDSLLDFLRKQYKESK